MQRLVLTCLCALALTAPALAQDPQVDANSPAGTEYQLPIDRAREQAGGGSRRSGDAAAETPLFGEGVNGTPSRSGEQRGSGGSARTPTTTVREQPKLGTSAPETVQTQAQAPEGGGSGLVAIGVGAAGVLLIGGLGGWAWRRRARAS